MTSQEILCLKRLKNLIIFQKEIALEFNISESIILCLFNNDDLMDNSDSFDLRNVELGNILYYQQWWNYGHFRDFDNIFGIIANNDTIINSCVGSVDENVPTSEIVVVQEIMSLIGWSNLFYFLQNVEQTQIHSNILKTLFPKKNALHPRMRVPLENTREKAGGERKTLTPYFLASI